MHTNYTDKHISIGGDFVYKQNWLQKVLFDLKSVTNE